MAESTPVSSVMRASTWTWLPFTLALTSAICGGFVSSARAAVGEEQGECGQDRDAHSSEISAQAAGGGKHAFNATRLSRRPEPAATASTETILEMPGSSMVTP